MPRFTQVSIGDMENWTRSPILTRVPVVLYVRTAHPNSRERFLAEGRAYAEARDWDVVAALSDSYAAGALSDRPGWRETQAWVSARRAAGIVTRYQSMIAPQDQLAGVDQWLRERGAFLTCTWQASALASAS